MTVKQQTATPVRSIGGGWRNSMRHSVFEETIYASSFGGFRSSAGEALDHLWNVALRKKGPEAQNCAGKLISLALKHGSFHDLRHLHMVAEDEAVQQMANNALLALHIAENPKDLTKAHLAHYACEEVTRLALEFRMLMITSNNQQHPIDPFSLKESVFYRQLLPGVNYDCLSLGKSGL